MDAIAQNAGIVRRFTKTFKNEHNVDGIDKLFSKSFRHHFAAPVRPGLEGFKDVGRMMNAAFPDVVVTEEDLIVTADKVVERSSAVATHRGDFMGVPPTNKRIGWTEIHIYRIADGEIAEHWVEFALQHILQQLTD
ncbi:MAG TPA: ester cyclase [Stellaceae bacterium]|nr:ester cyclase [Stellaceae bacterium]